MPEPSHYYYGPDGKRIELQPAEDTLAIAYREALPDRDIERAIRSDSELRPFMLSPELSVRRTTLFKRSPAAAASLEAFAERVNASDRVAFVAQTYRRGAQRMVVTDEFVAKFKENVSRDQIDAWLNSNGAEIIEALDFAPNTFLLRVLQPGLQGAIDVANRCFESGLADYAQPNFIKVQQRRAFTPNDPFFPQQWHLPRVSAEDAWDITRGDPNVIVAILDDSVDIDHEEFASAGKIVALFDFLQGDADPRPASSNDFHGTPVAGVAVADGNNGVGVSGMAPNCRLMPIRLVGAAQSDVTEANAFRHAVDNGAHIISNSWGPPDNGGPGPLPAIVGAAFDHALNVGRGGLGCVILFAAGNGNESISSAATLDGYASDNRVTAVGAVNDVNTRSGYSDFGLEVDVCAPSDGSTSGAWTGIPPDGSTLAIFTTDRSGTAGLNNADPFTGVVETAGGAVNYTGTFGGTSSACPLAAGVAALIVSIAPDLTRDQVVYVLEATADKVDFANTDPVGQYQANGHSQFYGFGRVNAHQAVRGARSSVADRDFVQSVQVTMRRTTGDRFVSVNELEAVDARRRPTDTPTVSFIRSGPDGFLRAEHGGAVDEVEVDS